MKNDLLYEVRSVSYSYLGRFAALKNINLAIRRGERIALLGANGSGKSTLLLVLAGLICPDEGTVMFSGSPLTEEALLDAAFQRTFRGSVGLIFQNSDIQLFNSSVRDEIEFGLAQLNFSGEEARLRLEKYVTLMDIERLLDRHPQYLSAGEKKRVAIASVLAMEPEVLLLDEPSAGLDPKTTRHLIDTMSELGEKGYTIITATQDVHIVPEIADRAVVLTENKEIAADNDISTILDDIEFLSAHNLIHIHAHRHRGKVHVHPHDHPPHEHHHKGQAGI